MLKSYLKKIHRVAGQGDAREESYYSTLELLLQDVAQSLSKPALHITTLPKTTEAGNPDFRIWDGTQHIVGYIEAKAPTVENLDAVEDSEQLRRYRNTFPNLILTNFFEFRLYRNGLLVDRVSVARPFIVHQLKTVPPVEHAPDFLRMLAEFYAFSLPRVYNARNLAVELAKRTSFLRDEVIAEELAEEDRSGDAFILGFYEAFKQFLIGGLSKEDFADLYAQTITYGLFAARMRSQNGFNRKLAYENIPRTIGILRDVFRFISMKDVPAQMEWIIDDISEVLSVADVNRILQNYFREGKGRDPVVHFYETFLAAYDPRIRERRGVYYTPEAVVSYIVRSINHILKDRFGRTAGLASDSVTVLDPASGTLTFLAEAAKLAVKEFESRYGTGAREGFVRDHILKNFYAFELMMAPYAVGHLKMSFLLEELGYALEKDDRFKLYLTNTLEIEDLDQTSFPGMASLSEESRLAGQVKKEQPILAIMGNPPYSGHSANKGQWIDGLLKEGYTRAGGSEDAGYYRIDGKPLGEKNPKWLQDDYVKFIRFGQWKIDQAGEGVLGFITNHSYLDNPTFRGMRRSLMESFDEIYLLDLHGNSLKKERCPDGSKDENVFDIRQGTAVALFVKTKDGRDNKGAQIYHAERWGLREEKYNWLSGNDIATTQWRGIVPIEDFYLFVPLDERLLKRYRESPKITEIFPINSVGIVTARDKLTIQWTPEKVWTAVLNFSTMDPELARMTYSLGRDARDWKVAFAQKDLTDSGPDRSNIVSILYRPFDVRYTYYTGRTRGFHCMPRRDVMRHMMKENFALITPKQNKDEFGAIAAKVIGTHKTVAAYDVNYYFPLFLYPDPDTKDLLSDLEESQERRPNIAGTIWSALSEAYGESPTPEDIFYYIYAVLYSDTYRTKYVEFLKIDFPRVPFTRNPGLFTELADQGRRLASVHLMKSPELESPCVKFQGTGDMTVDKIRYSKNDERLYINSDHYFEGMTESVWTYRIGGYQVCDKWLKDRRGRYLSLDDVKHYCRIVTVLEHTIRIQKDIDVIYEEAERNLIAFP